MKTKTRSEVALSRALSTVVAGVALAMFASPAIAATSFLETTTTPTIPPYLTDWVTMSSGNSSWTRARLWSVGATPSQDVMVYDRPFTPGLPGGSGAQFTTFTVSTGVNYYAVNSGETHNGVQGPGRTVTYWSSKSNAAGYL